MTLHSPMEPPTQGPPDETFVTSSVDLDDPYAAADARGPIDYTTGKAYQSPTEMGLIHGYYGPDTLAEAARRREAGASLSAIRRDLCLDGAHDVSDATLERAVDGAGRLILEHMITRKPVERKRYWGGIDRLPTQAEYLAARAPKGGS